MNKHKDAFIKAYTIVNNMNITVSTLKGLLWGLDKAYDKKRQGKFRRLLHRKLARIARDNAELRDVLKPVIGNPEADPGPPPKSLFES